MGDRVSGIRLDIICINYVISVLLYGDFNDINSFKALHMKIGNLGSKLSLPFAYWPTNMLSPNLLLNFRD
eukprot:6466249-Amphidinium_carterae.3